jgi:hypothetical protein
MTSRIKTKIMFETTNQQYDPISKVSTRREGDFSKHLWTIDLGKLPSGKRLQFANLKIAIEIVDLPMIFHFFLYVYQRVLFLQPIPNKNEWMNKPENQLLPLLCTLESSHIHPRINRAGKSINFVCEEKKPRTRVGSHGTAVVRSVD